MSIQSNINMIFRFAVITLMVMVSASIFISCSDELEFPVPASPDAEAGYITLTIKAGQHTTRAEEPGVESLNENLINSVVVCLTSSAGDRTNEDAPVYINTFDNINEQNEAVIRIPLTAELTTRLFNEDGDNECRVFAAVNVERGTANTIAELRQLAVDLDFNKITRKQGSFAMDGDAIVKYNPSQNYATGTVPVQRSAAKISLALDVDTSVEETVGSNTLTWIPNLSEMRVVLHEGVKNSNLDPKPEPNMSEDVYFNTPEDHNYKFETVTRPSGDKYAKYNREQDVPFYTYPNKWTDNVDERHATKLMLSVPWSSDGGATWRTCYYNVPIVPIDKFELVRNHSYHIYLHVGVLGSFIPDEPLEIEADYFVAEWGSENINVDIKDFRYLVVDEHVYTVNNEESIAIQFYTSHKTIVTDVKMKFYRYNFSDQGSEFAVTVSDAQNKNSKARGDTVYYCDFDNDKDILNLSHDLCIWVPYNSSDKEVSLIKGLDTGAITNVRDANGRYFLDNKDALDKVLNTIHHFKKIESGESEYSRIEYEITVQHEDVYDGSSGINKSLYKETVTITQYPGMYITAVQNYADNLANRKYTSGSLGNTIINGRYDNTNYTTPGNSSNWGDRHLAYNYRNWDYSLGLGFPPSYFNWNPNMYLVTITQLESGTKYRIGDPRSFNVNNYLANDGAYDGYTVDGGTDKVFADEYWYYQVGNNNYGADTDPYFGGPNPRPKHYSYSSTWWVEYKVNGFTTARAWNGTSFESKNRTLKYYYPTREADDNKYTVAPKFRICSSYGGTSGYITREMARRRAAAYQELGYYAGRWRLPTFGEVEYVMKLAADQKIPRLFGTNASGTWYYWCAQGAVQVPAGNETTKEIKIEPNPTNGASGAAAYPFVGDNYKDHARFVYDEWYWGGGTVSPTSTTPNTTAPTYPFTWGDRLKTSPQ